MMMLRMSCLPEGNLPEEVQKSFVLFPEACLVVSVTSTVARTFGPALSEEYAPVVLAGGGGGWLLWHTPWSW